MCYALCRTNIKNDCLLGAGNQEGKMSLGRRQKVLNPIFLGVIALLLLSCSATQPQEDAKKRIESNYKNMVKVVSFKETDSRNMDLAGKKIYKMTYEAEIEYLDDVVVARAGGRVHEIRKGLKSPMEDSAEEFKRGAREKIKGSFVFQWANAWRLVPEHVEKGEEKK
jgi:hypothetical protein